MSQAEKRRKDLVGDAIYHMKLIDEKLFETIRDTEGFSYWFNKLTNIASLTDDEIK